MVDLRERPLLTQPVALPFVALGVDRLLEEEGVIEAVQLLLNELDALFLPDRPILRLRPPLLPSVENPVLDQAHVAGCRLQEREFIGERAFEHGLADVHRAALTLTVVVGVMPVTTLRPTAGERAT